AQLLLVRDHLLEKVVLLPVTTPQISDCLGKTSTLVKNFPLLFLYLIWFVLFNLYYNYGLLIHLLIHHLQWYRQKYRPFLKNHVLILLFFAHSNILLLTFFIFSQFE